MSRKIYLCGHGHIDPVWLWRWQDGVSEVLATFDSALNRMNEFEDFVFVSSSAQFYKWVEETDTKMFERIKQRVKEGRFLIAGGWWVEPDCNMPSLESFIRQQLYGQNYFKEKFGIAAKVGMNPDSFGHCSILPQVLKGGGIESYIFTRPGESEKKIEDPLFLWKSHDGSSITAYQMPNGYNGSGKQFHNRLLAMKNPQKHDELIFFGVGNHGGGPTIETLEFMKKNLSDKKYFMHSGPDDYFKAAKDSKIELPVVEGELQHHARGCYSAHSGIKSWNRRTESSLIQAEILSSMAIMCGMDKKDCKALDTAWEKLLLNQFHDTLGGTCLKSCYEDSVNQLGEAMSTADDLSYKSAAFIAQHINVSSTKGGLPVVVFNRHPYSVKEFMQVQITHIDRYGYPPNMQYSIKVLDENDREIESQMVMADATVFDVRQVGFMADVEPMGWRMYRIVLEEGAAPENIPEIQNIVENELYKVEINAFTGAINIFDKKKSRSVTGLNGIRAAVYNDPSDTWSHEVEKYDEFIGYFDKDSICATEEGSVRSVINAKLVYNKSELELELIIYNDLERIDINGRLNCKEKNKTIKLRVPCDIENAICTWSMPGSEEQRQNDGCEEPMADYLDISNDKYGVSVLNKGLYGCDINGNDMGITIARTPPYGHHYPTPLDERLKDRYEWMEQGIREFELALYPHNGNCQKGSVRKEAGVFNGPLYMIRTHFHQGDLSNNNSLCSGMKNNIEITALKIAYSGEGYILRVQETNGKHANAVMNFNAIGRKVEIKLDPWQIQTYFMPFDENQPCILTNLLEKEEI